MSNRKSMEDRFWSKVQKTATCWLWKGNKDKEGYGRFGDLRLPGGRVRSHRFSWSQHNKEKAIGLVKQTCKNRLCVNPAHLLLAATVADRFFAKVVKQKGCWLWLAGVNRDGYGQIAVNGKATGAHRLSWELHVHFPTLDIRAIFSDNMMKESTKDSDAMFTARLNQSLNL